MNPTTQYIVLASLMSLSAASTTLGSPDSGRADAASATTGSDQVLVATEAGPTRFPTRNITTIGTSPYHWKTDADSDSETPNGRSNPELLEPVHDPMDVDQNGVVDFKDFVQLMRWFGTEEGDLNQDGQTDGADIGLILDRLANQNP